MPKLCLCLQVSQNLYPYLARGPFPVIKIPSFMSSANLHFLLIFYLLFFLNLICSDSLYIWSISILAFLFTFTAKLLKRISLLLRHCLVYFRLDSLIKTSPKWFLLPSPLLSMFKELLGVFKFLLDLSIAFETVNFPFLLIYLFP